MRGTQSSRVAGDDHQSVGWQVRYAGGQVMPAGQREEAQGWGPKTSGSGGKRGNLLHDSGQSIQ